MMMRIGLFAFTAICGCSVEQDAPPLQVCSAYEECLNSAGLSAQESQSVRRQLDAQERCLELQDDPFICERQCLSDYSNFVSARPPEPSCDPLMTLQWQSFAGRAYAKPEMDDVDGFVFALVVVGVDDQTVTLEIGTPSDDAPAVLLCPRFTQVGFACDPVIGSRGETTLQGAINSGGSGLTGDMVLTEVDGTVIEWWYTAAINE